MPKDGFAAQSGGAVQARVDLGAMPLDRGLDFAACQCSAGHRAFWSNDDRLRQELEGPPSSADKPESGRAR
jgi:hypothetical protein